MTLFNSLRKAGRFFTKVETAQTPGILSAVFSASGSGSGLFGQKFSFTKAVASGYKDLVWVYRCVAKKGESVGSVPWKVYRKASATTAREHLIDHPLQKLIDRPNKYMDRTQFFIQWISDLDLGGNSYWEIAREGGRPSGLPIGLWRMRPDWTTPRPGKETFLRDYKFDTGSGTPAYFPVDDVVHMKYVDPVDPYVGMSVIQAAARTILTENAAIGWNKSILDNSGVPNGILKVPAQTMLSQDKTVLQENIEDEFSTEDSRHRPMILWGGMEWESMSLSQKDMDFLEQRKYNKFEICADFAVPPMVVGALENPTYSNYAVARLSFWEDTITPLLDWLKSHLNYRLAPYYGPDIEIDYDLSQVPAMREAFKQLVDTAKSLHEMNYPINAISARLNLGMEAVPWGDVAWINQSLIPTVPVDGGAVRPTDEDLEDDEGNPNDPFRLQPVDDEARRGRLV